MIHCVIIMMIHRLYLGNKMFDRILITCLVLFVIITVLFTHEYDERIKDKCIVQTDKLYKLDYDGTWIKAYEACIKKQHIKGKIR